MSDNQPQDNELDETETTASDAVVETDEEELPDMARAVEGLRKAKDELKACQSERKEYLEGWQRARADFINFKKEQERLLSELSKMGEDRVLTELFSIADSFEQAFSHKELFEQTPPALRLGFEQIERELTKLFEKYQVQSFGEIGEVFDPKIHNAVASQTTAEPSRDHTIAEVHKKGYRRDDHIIRPALVVVWMPELESKK